MQTPNEKRFRVGDEWKFVSKDNLTGKITEGANNVERIENGLVYIKHPSGNYIIRTEDGAQLTGVNTVDGYIKWDPPEVRQPGGIFEVGDKWVSESILTIGSGWSSPRKTNGKVVSIEDLTIGGQIIKTYKVEASSFNYGDGSEVFMQGWYQPGFGIPLKAVYELRERRTGLTRSTTTELTSFRKGSG